MTIHERMVARSEREKDLLKYGRGQERERIIKLLEDNLRTVQIKGYPEWTWQTNAEIIALIKKEQK